MSCLKQPRLCKDKKNKTFCQISAPALLNLNNTFNRECEKLTWTHRAAMCVNTKLKANKQTSSYMNNICARRLHFSQLSTVPYIYLLCLRGSLVVPGCELKTTKLPLPSRSILPYKFLKHGKHAVVTIIRRTFKGFSKRHNQNRDASSLFSKKTCVDIQLSTAKQTKAQARWKPGFDHCVNSCSSAWRISLGNPGSHVLAAASVNVSHV